jgi:hypothetical protein
MKMPIEFKFFSIAEAAKQLGRQPAALSSYCSRLNIGQKFGHSRMLTPADIDRLKQIKMGRPKKNPQLST